MTAELDPVVREFLAAPRYAVLATINPDGMPQQTPVWYELRDSVVYLNTRAGRLKERNLRRDVRASLCVVDGERYVTLRGKVQVRPGPQGFEGIRALAIRYHGTEAGERQAEQYRGQERVDCFLIIDHVHAAL
jgi:PPOX class probable F420-dependent enzyme